MDRIKAWQRIAELKLPAIIQQNLLLNAQEQLNKWVFDTSLIDYRVN